MTDTDLTLAEALARRATAAKKKGSTHYSYDLCIVLIPQKNFFDLMWPERPLTEKVLKFS